MTATNDDVKNELEDDVVDVFADDAMEVITATPEETNVEPQTTDATDGDDDDETIPTKFKGKGLGEVIESYTALEREFGRRNNEVSDMRKTLDNILAQQLEGNTGEVTEEDEDAAAVEKALAKSPTLKAVTDGLEAQTRARAQAEFDEAHPDARKIVESKAFVKWVTDSPVRTNQFRDANGKFDYATIGDMLGTYTELSAVRQERVTAKREGDMKSLSTPEADGGGAAVGAAKRKVFKLSDLMKLRDTDPERYEKLGTVINKAYAEGRVLRDK